MRKKNFRARWLERFGLPPTGWKTAIRARLEELPFCDAETAGTLLLFLFGDLPKLLKERCEPESERLAEAFAWVCFSFWQCGSAFPAFPENYAQFLHGELLKLPRERDPGTIALAGLLAHGPEPAGGDGRCGFNRLALSATAVIRDSETLMHEGRYEFYLKAREKYAEYECYLEQSGEFRADWDRIKACYGELRGQEIVRRSLIPERNWERGPGAQFADAAQRFQAVFDLFCWKYYLWGMKGDSPLLQKTSVVFTPYGTQIFIPGYLSFDPKRDLDFSKVTRLHRARGISRQGPGFSVGRRELAETPFSRRKPRTARQSVKG